MNAKKVHVGHNPIRDYDAHIYYSLEQRSLAVRLRTQMLKAFPVQTVLVGPFIDRLVGPHPLPMFEVNFTKERFKEITLWLEKNRGQLNILVHEVTGHDPRDHSIGATWLGERLMLDESKLDPPPL